MRNYSVLDLDTKEYGGIEKLFPNWCGSDERLCVYSPHDDDAIIGAGYAMRAALDAGAEVHIIIVCNGCAGYSTVEEKDQIVETRRKETLNCYKEFGIPEENIVFLNIPDFSALSYVGWNIAPGREGHFRQTIVELRKRKITRVLVPNHYREHVDHVAASMMATFDAPQSGDAFSVDWGEPQPIRSVAEYCVWADLDPEDAIVRGRSPVLRANTVLLASADVEEYVNRGIEKYVSQQEIIEGLIQARKERKINDGRFIEVYLRFDPRPRMNYEPYRRVVESIATET